MTLNVIIVSIFCVAAQIEVLHANRHPYNTRDAYEKEFIQNISNGFTMDVHHYGDWLKAENNFLYICTMNYATIYPNFERMPNDEPEDEVFTKCESEKLPKSINPSASNNPIKFTTPLYQHYNGYDVDLVSCQCNTSILSSDSDLNHQIRTERFTLAKKAHDHHYFHLEYEGQTEPTEPGYYIIKNYYEFSETDVLYFAQNYNYDPFHMGA